MYVSVCHLLLGSNLGDRKKNLKTAVMSLKRELGKIQKESKILETEAVGFASNHKFLNQILLLETIYSPMQTLHITQAIEKQIGREKKTKFQNYEDRIIDIDILTFNDIIFESKNLQIPHRNNMENRSFVYELFLNL